MRFDALLKSIVIQSGLPHATSLTFLGALVSGLLLSCGVIFSTYSISMSTTGLEAARQLGLPFMLAELGVIFWAVRRGFRLQSVWSQFPLNVKWLTGLFLATFWVGSALYSPIAIVSLAQNLFFLTHIIFACAISQSVGCFIPIELERMAKNFGIGLFIFCWLTAYALVFHPPFSSMPNNEIIWQFAIPGFISLRLFGAFCGALFCFILGVLLLADERRDLNIWHFMWLTLSAGMMIWSGTRAAVLGSILALLLIVPAFRFVPSFRAALGVLASLMVAAILAVALIPYGDPTFMLFSPGDSASADAASGGRFSYWAAIWQAYQKVPLFGAGPFASQVLMEKGQPIHVQPHNIVLQFLITWGVFATVFALSLLAIATLKAHKIASRHRTTLPFILMIDCLLVMSLLDGMMHFAQHLMLIMIGFGAVFGYDRAYMAGSMASTK